MRAAATRPATGSVGADLVSTALALVEQEGEEGLGWNRLARALGVKPPSLYNHVASHADLRRRVAIAGWERFLPRAARAAAGTRAPRETLRRLAAASRAFAQEHPGLYGLLAATPVPPDDPDFAPTSRALLALFDAPLAALGLAAVDRVHAVRGIRAAVHGFVMLERGGQFGLPERVEQSFTRLVDALLDGYAGAAPISPRRRTARAD